MYTTNPCAFSVAYYILDPVKWTLLIFHFKEYVWGNEGSGILRKKKKGFFFTSSVFEER